MGSAARDHDWSAPHQDRSWVGDSRAAGGKVEAEKARLIDARKIRQRTHRSAEKQQEPGRWRHWITAARRRKERKPHPPPRGISTSKLPATAPATALHPAADRPGAVIRPHARLAFPCHITALPLPCPARRAAPPLQAAAAALPAAGRRPTRLPLPNLMVQRSRRTPTMVSTPWEIPEYELNPGELRFRKRD